MKESTLERSFHGIDDARSYINATFGENAKHFYVSCRESHDYHVAINEDAIAQDADICRLIVLLGKKDPVLLERSIHGLAWEWKCKFISMVLDLQNDLKYRAKENDS